MTCHVSKIGYDLASAVDIVVPAKGKAIVKTDLAIAIPENTYARIAPRSGLAVKHFIDVGAGVVDYDYRGNVGVVLFNHSDTDFTVQQSDRIAQLILEKISMVPVEEVSELPSTERGAGGFGSTGTETLKMEVTDAHSSSSSSPKRIKLGGMFLFYVPVLIFANCMFVCMFHFNYHIKCSVRLSLYHLNCHLKHTLAVLYY